MEASVPEVLELGTVRVDFARRLLVRDGVEQPLAEKEYGILRLLAAHPGETVSREQFLDVV